MGKTQHHRETGALCPTECAEYNVNSQKSTEEHQLLLISGQDEPPTGDVREFETFPEVGVVVVTGGVWFSV